MGHSGHQLPKDAFGRQWRLYTRGGTNDVFIQCESMDAKVEVPQPLLRMLVAEDIRSEMIELYEQAETEEILKELL